MHAAVTAALGALKGPLHGGASDTTMTMKMLEEVGSPEHADAHVANGFGEQAEALRVRAPRVQDRRPAHEDAKIR